MTKLLRQPLNRLPAFGLVILLVLHLFGSNALALRIRDVARLSTETPNELVGMGIVVGLKGTGDGGDFLPTMRPLKEMMRRFDDPVTLDKELKNANNIAIVMLSMKLPSQGAHAGDAFDIKVSALAAKSLRGGQLFIVPMFAPRTDVKIVLASASGHLLLDDESHPTQAIIRKGGVLIEDISPDKIDPAQFTLALRPEDASRETASAIADQINEEVAPQTGDHTVAMATDGTTVVVNVPAAEQRNVTPFIARIMTLKLPNLPQAARVRINLKTKTIVFTDEVELAPTMISHGNLTITVTAPDQPANPPGSHVPFVTLDPEKTGNARLKDLEAAFNMLKVSADDRIAIVQALYDIHALKAELIIE